MSNYMNERGYDSETKGTKRSAYCRSELLGNILQSIDSDISVQNANRRREERRQIQGNGKFTMEGSNDRINGMSYNGNDIVKYPTEDDRKSYHYGYTVHGGRRLMNVVEQLIKAEKYEEIVLIAERDYNNGLQEKDLGMVTNIPEYLEAYRMIANRNVRK